MSMGRKYYRTASIELVDKIARELPEAVNGTRRRRAEHPRMYFTSAGEMVRWILRRGPVRLRIRRRDLMTADLTTGALTMIGEKNERITAAIIGYDGARGFRVLMPFGVTWGQAGRCWMSIAQITKLTRDGETRFDAVDWSFD